MKRQEILKLVRSAGIKWLALGIESGDKNVRLEVSKGKFELRTHSASAPIKDERW